MTTNVIQVVVGPAFGGSAMEFDLKQREHLHSPPQLPVTILDMERSPVGHTFDMELPMADPCPSCGGFNMRVGDWVCHGSCWPCEEQLHLALEADMLRNEDILRAEGVLRGNLL